MEDQKESEPKYSPHADENSGSRYHSSREISERDEKSSQEFCKMGQTEKDLLETNERLRSVVETAYDPIICTDGFGNIMMWNSAAAQTFGYSAEEVMNRPVTILMPERFVSIHEMAMQRAVAVGRLFYAKHLREVFGLRKDGTEFPIEISLSAGMTQEGMVFTAIVRDITERKQKEEELRRANEELELRVAERTAELVETNKDLRQEIGERERVEQMLRNSEQLYHTLVEEVPDVIFILDNEGRFSYLNAQAEELLRRPIEEILETPLTSHVVPDQREKIESIFRLSPESIWDEEIRLLDSEGETRFARIRCKALGRDRNGDSQYEGVMRDITQRRKLEEQLQESRSQLLEKIRIIDELYAHIVESGKAKAIVQHTAEVAHELRQPLTIIGGFARRIERQLNLCKIRTDEGKADAVRIISAEVQRLERILNNLLDFTRRESVSQELVNPHEIIQKVITFYEGSFQGKDIKLDIQLRGEVGEIFVDPDRFEQVVRNLVDNAIDASLPGETLHIETGVSKPSSKALETAALEWDRYFEMKIRNRGPAIRDEDLQRIFSPFYTTKEYGTGIGLTAAKKIVEAHNGSISVNSDDKGTTFTVWLPLPHNSPATRRFA